jgi:predicted Ser/Thr protein kinase
MEKIPWTSIALFLLCVALIGLGLLIAGILVVRHFWQKKPVSPPLPQPPLASPRVVAATVALPKCPQCNLPLAPNAPEGLCPACLAKVALGTEPVAPGATININPLAEAAPSTSVAPDPAQLAAQFPQLEIIELLGMGGMGMVYKARQPRVDRLVALKILPVESSRGASFAERFQREAKALAKLNHPGIVTFYDFGQTSEYYYFIMEYVDGMNLRHLLQTQPLEPRQALELVMQICTALQYAHDEGVVHRDIKPENILLNKKGQVKIADFGLAKLLGTAPDTALTMSQAAMGTLNYMAPEQRQNAQGVDHRADIYSLGVVFYEMLTGEVPMGRFEPPSKRVHVDVRLDEVVLRALEREPTRRYQQASEVKTEVESITEGQARVQAKGQTQLPKSEWPAIAAGAGKVLALSAAIGLAMWTLHTAWPLVLVLLGSLGFDRTAGPQERRWVKSVWVLSVTGLCGYGVWISKTVWPLVALFSLFNWGNDDEGEEGSEKDMTSPRDETPTHRPEPPPAAAPPATPIASQRTIRGQRTSGKQKWYQMGVSGWFGVFLCLNGLIVFQLLSGSESGTPQQQNLASRIFELGFLGLGCGIVLWGRTAWRRKKLSRWEIRLARERGLWPPLGEQPSLEHVKRMAQAGEKFMAINLHREIHGVSLVDAKAAVEKLSVHSAPPQDAKAQSAVATPPAAPKRFPTAIKVLLAISLIPLTFAIVGCYEHGGHYICFKTSPWSRARPWNWSCRFAPPSSTRTTKESSIATSSRRTSS